jgi:hypothetical protein
MAVRLGALLLGLAGRCLAQPVCPKITPKPNPLYLSLVVNDVTKC